MDKTLSFFAVVHLLKRNLVWIISSTLVGFVSFLLFSIFFITPMYTSYVDIYVYNSAKIDTETGHTNSQININDFYLASRLVDTYVIMLKNRAVMTQVADGLSKKMSPGQVASSVSLKSVDETEILRITATTADKNLSAEICNKLVAIAPAYLTENAMVGGVKILFDAVPPADSSSPNIKFNALIGGIFGLAASVSIVILAYHLDNTVKGEEDLKLYIDVPVLGEIPTFEATDIGGVERG